MKAAKSILIACFIVSVCFKLDAQLDTSNFQYDLLQNTKVNYFDRLMDGTYETWDSYIANGIVALQNWSKDEGISQNKGIVLLFMKADDDKVWFQAKKIYRQTNFYNSGYPYPDYYSYYDSSLLFWYFGAYRFLQPPAEYKQFIKAKLEKYLYDDMTSEGLVFDEQINKDPV
jgi:hypothetical protein